MENSEKHTDYLVPKQDFTPPPKHIVEFLYKGLNAYFQPTYLGLEHVDKQRPALYIGNHTLLGITDGPLYGAELYLEKDIFLRTLVDNMHRKIPVSRSVMTDYGAVYGSRENCTKLMEQKQHILLYPGGTREVCKKKDELYTLVWKQRYGFVKLAIANGYPIIPVAGLGGDDVFDIRMDSGDIMTSPLGDVLHFTGLDKALFKDGEHIPPLVTGIGLTPIPKPQKIYYQFSEAIETTPYKGQEDDKEILHLVRDLVADSLNKSLHHLQLKRSQDKEVAPWRKFLNNL